MSSSFTVLLSLLLLSFLTQGVPTATPKIEMRDVKMSNDVLNAQGPRIGEALKEMVMRVHFREKYMRKKGIELITAELEEELQEEEFAYTNMNIRDGGRLVWIMCSDPEERENIKNYLVKKEVLLVVETGGKRFFGKFASQAEKQSWKEENKGKDSLFGGAAGVKKEPTNKADEL
jgi:23S rRNA pseudoU1915 N3-methylase RlmH